MSAQRCVLIFLKSPDPGMVKSRLSRDIGAETVLSLYKNFCLDLLETLRRGRHAFKIFFYPPESEERIAEWLGRDCSYVPQRGSDLGERMKNAFILTFAEGFSRVLLIGSDIPDLPNTILHEAFGFESYDAVIGPAFDGGYYLIGFKNNTFLPEIFEGIPWGADGVFKKTMERFRMSRCKVHLLPTWRDVDTSDDLRALVEKNRDTEFADSRTMAFISKNRVRLFKD
jgi:rSAM/selenodomain-associated transferase 1